VKVWRNYVPEAGTLSPSAQLVTAWQALTDMLPIAKGSGLVVDWDQTSSLMYTSGDVRIVRIWDTETELRVQVVIIIIIIFICQKVNEVPLARLLLLLLHCHTNTHVTSAASSLSTLRRETKSRLYRHSFVWLTEVWHCLLFSLIDSNCQCKWHCILNLIVVNYLHNLL